MFIYTQLCARVIKKNSGVFILRNTITRSLWVTFSQLAKSAVNTNRPIYLGVYVALMKEVDREAFFVVELAPVKKEKKIYCNIKKKRAGESKKLK